MKRKTNMQEKGITLVALIVTVVVLLILAGVVIATVTSNNGILSKSKFARDKYQNSANGEYDTLSDYEKLINNVDKNAQDSKIIAEQVSFQSPSSDWKVTNVKQALDYLYNN